MKYFIDPYKKYYDNLKDASGMSSAASTISDSVGALGTSSSTLTSGISASTWQEIGASEVINTIIPGLSTLLSKLSSDVSSTLAVAVAKASEIAAKSGELKTKDEEYEKESTALEELKNNPPARYDDENNERAEYRTWKTNVSEKEEKVKKLEEDCKNLQGEIDGLAGDINALEVSKAEDISITVGSGAQNNTNLQVLDNDGTFVKISYSGSTFRVINTKNISVVDFVKYIQQYKLEQNDQPGYGDACLGVAKAYGNRMYNNTKLYTDMKSFYSGSYTSFDKGYYSANKQEILGLVYDEITQGKPCVIMVTTKAGHRHFATVVGMKDTVTSRESLQEEDLLIIDSWDGKLEAMDNSVTADRHMHLEGGKYRIDRLLA